jgi:hypothetical protein
MLMAVAPTVALPDMLMASLALESIAMGPLWTVMVELPVTLRAGPALGLKMHIPHAGPGLPTEALEVVVTESQWIPRNEPRGALRVTVALARTDATWEAVVVELPDAAR